MEFITLFEADKGRYPSYPNFLQAGRYYGVAVFADSCAHCIQYELVWTNKNSTSIVWFAILFAILRITMLDYIREGDEPIEYMGRCQELATSFRNSFTDCLILADYTQPHEFLIEALVLHKYAEYVSSRDARSSVWVLSGMIIRMATRMGYHQSSQLGLNLSPFQVNPHPSVQLEDGPLTTTIIGRLRCVVGLGLL